MSIARLSLVLFAMCAVGGVLLGSPALAEKLPADTNTIKSLTPEQARKLVKEFPGVEGSVELGDGASMGYPRCLPLNGLKWVDTETAEALTGYTRGPLLLNGLSALPEEAAKALAQQKEDVWLSLNGLTTLSEEAAKALAQYKGGMSLNGLTTLSAGAAKALAQHKKWLYLNGLTTLSDEAAEALTQHDGRILSLRGLTTLSDEAAKALTRYEGMVNVGYQVFPTGKPLTADRARPWLELLGGALPAITTLDAPDSIAIAKALAASKSPIVLCNLTSISDEAARALAQQKGGYLSLNGLTTLSDDAAKALAQHKGRLFLHGVTTLSDEAAEALARHEGEITVNPQAFPIEKPLTVDLALAWATLLKGDLSRVIAIDSPDSVAIAQALASREGPLKLPNLWKISPKTLAALLEKEDIEIPPIETLKLIPEPDGSVTDDFVIPERLKPR
jgi:hypothetical protein